MTPALNDQLHAYADQVGAGAASAVDRTWRALWERMKPGPAAASHNYAVALGLVGTLPLQLYQSLRAGVAGLLHWSYGEAGRTLLGRLPREAVYRIVAQRTAWRPPWLLERVEPLTLAIGADRGDEADYLQRLLFPPLPAEKVHDFLASILPATSWTTLGDTATGATPATLAGLIASRYAAGDSTRDVATAVLPWFDGSRVRAQRAARTFGAFVGTKATVEAAEQLGDLILGYTVHDPGGPTARPDHMKRSGTRYMRHPKPGEYPLSVMPQPPLDRGGPHEDGEGVKWNCRCWLSPILANSA